MYAGLERLFALLDVCRVRTNETRPRGAAKTSLALPYPFRTWPGSGTWAERDKREVRKFCILGGIRATLGSWHMQSLNEKNIWENIYFQFGDISKFWRLISSPPHFFLGHTSKRLAYCRTTAASLLFDIRFHG